MSGFGLTYNIDIFGSDMSDKQRKNMSLLIESGFTPSTSGGMTFSSKNMIQPIVGCVFVQNQNGGLSQIVSLNSSQMQNYYTYTNNSHPCTYCCFKINGSKVSNCNYSHPESKNCNQCQFIR